MLKILAAAAALALFASSAHAADTPTRPPVVAGDTPDMWVKPGTPERPDRLKADFERGLRNPTAFDPKKPPTAIYLVAGPVAAVAVGFGLVAAATSGLIAVAP